MAATDDLAVYLATRSTAFTAGATIFRGHLPETTGRALAVFETGGLPPVHTFAGSLPKVERPRVQLIARSTKPVGAGPASATGVRAMIGVAWQLVDGIANQTLSGTTYLRVAAVQQPFLLEVDSRGRQVWSFSADVQRRKTTANQ